MRFVRADFLRRGKEKAMDKALIVAKLQAQLDYLGNYELAWINKVFHSNDGLVEMAYLCGAITSGERGRLE